MAYGKRAYASLKKETASGTAVTPNVPFEFFEESINPNYENNYLAPAANIRSKMYRAVIGKNGPPTGTIKIPVQAKTIGYFLTGTYGSPSTSAPADTTAYTHTFTETATGTIPTYTIDFGYTDLSYVNRFYGVRFGNMRTMFEDNTLMAEFDVQAIGAFTVTQVTTTASSGTALVVASTAGLVTGETITVSYADTTNSADYTITVNSETSLTLGSAITGKTHTAGDRVVLKTQTPSYSVGSTFTGVGGTQFAIGLTLGTVANADAEDFTFEFAQELEARHALTGTAESDRWPVANLVKGYEAKASFKWYHSDPKWVNYLRARSQLAVQVTSTGTVLAGAATVYDSIRFDLANLRINSFRPPIGSDDIIEDEIEATAVYDSSNAFVSRVVLVNNVSSY